MNKEIKQPTNRARALILKEGEVLFIERIRNGNTAIVLPGGHIEESETPEQAVIREVAEETSIMFELERKLTEIQTADGTTHHIFLCTYISGNPKLHDASPEKNESGTDTYTPKWMKIHSIPSLPIWPAEMKSFLLEYFRL